MRKVGAVLLAMVTVGLGCVATESSPLAWGQAGDGSWWSASATPLTDLNPISAANPKLNPSSVSCPVSGWCVGVGSYTDTAAQQEGFLETLSNSVSAVSLPLFDLGGPNPSAANAINLNRVTCPSQGWCFAVGSYVDSAGNQQGVIATLSGGTWTAVPAPLGGLNPASASNPGASLNDIGCSPPGPAAEYCIAVGTYRDVSGGQDGLIETLDNNTWNPLAAPVNGLNPASSTTPSVALGSVSCPGTGTCTAVGSYYDTSGYQQGLIVLMGTAISAMTLPTADLNPSPYFQTGAPGLRLQKIVCPTTGMCAAVGAYQTASGAGDGLVATWSTGNPWTATTAPIPTSEATFFYDLSCPTAGWCVAVGRYSPSTNVPPVELITLSDGTWTGSTPPNVDTGTDDWSMLLQSISCTQIGSCVAVGSTHSTDGLIDTLNNGTWSASSAPLGGLSPPSGTGSNESAFLTTVTCPTVDACVALGQYADTSSDRQGLIQEQHPQTATSTTVTSSANPIWAGSSATLTAAVTPSPDGGTVTFYDGSEAVTGCSGLALDLATSSATCTVTESAAGGHPITADYSGTAMYGYSTGSMTETVQTPPPCPTGVTHLATGEPWAIASMNSTIDNRLCAGYWVATRTGGVTAIGAAPWLGDMSGRVLNAAVIGIAATPSGDGYYLLGADGGVFTFGHAVFRGSTGSMHLNAPVVAMAGTPDGSRYWLAAADGGVFTFGNATFYGSMGGHHLNQPVVGMSADAQTGGYWLVASDGGVFAFDTPFYGSMGGQHLNQPVVGMTPQPNGNGYRLVAHDGGVFDFGEAAFYGSLPGEGVQNPQVTTMAASVDGNGYYLINGSGTIWNFGDAPYLGNA